MSFRVLATAIEVCPLECYVFHCYRDMSFRVLCTPLVCGVHFTAIEVLETKLYAVLHTRHFKFACNDEFDTKFINCMHISE